MGRLLKPGQDPGDVVFAEKRREDAVRRTTNGIMVRFDLERPARALRASTAAPAPASPYGVSPSLLGTANAHLADGVRAAKRGTPTG